MIKIAKSRHLSVPLPTRKSSRALRSAGPAEGRGEDTLFIWVYISAVPPLLDPISSCNGPDPHTEGFIERQAMKVRQPLAKNSPKSGVRRDEPVDINR